MITSLLMALLLATAPVVQTEFPSILDAISNLLQGFSTGAKALFEKVSFIIADLFVFVSRAVYSALIVGGLFLNYTRINRRIGADWIKGGILLGLISELAPYLFKSLS